MGSLSTIKRSGITLYDRREEDHTAWKNGVGSHYIIKASGIILFNTGFNFWIKM